MKGQLIEDSFYQMSINKETSNKHIYTL